MPMSGLEVESSEIDAKKVRVHDWITNEISQILLEEFWGIIGRIMDRLIVRFEEGTAVIRNVEEIAKVN